jgi:RNA-directed DNA polymerase
LKNSNEIRKLQKTQYRDWLYEEGVELRGSKGEHSNPSAFEKGKDDESAYDDVLLEKILDRDNLNNAFKRVKSNKGSHGVDGMKVDELLPFLKQNGESIKRAIIEGTYNPTPVRRVEIPKPDGGVRLLGIPTVLDRLIQQAIAQVLSPIFENEFSDNSYGFRPHRSAKDAILKAKTYIEEGNKWVIDIDLAKYFDTVNHDKLMSLLSRKVKNKRVLELIRKYLNSGVMINGLKMNTDKGCPQGGPLSPLLSNIMLNEFDKELEKRGHKFCRYADDSNVYVRSKRAGERVMISLTTYLEKVLKLKVNKGKSAVDRPWRRKFLGFSFYYFYKKIGIKAHEKSIRKYKDKVREVTSRSLSISMDKRIDKLNKINIGWINYFGIADIKGKIKALDEWTRRRIRMCHWKQWKKIKTKHDNLKRLGIDKFKAWEYANTRKGYWRISNSPILAMSITNKYLEKQGFKSLTARYALIH